eukprot:6621221-Alexandrium_andersonii.AAC.1
MFDDGLSTALPRISLASWAGHLARLPLDRPVRRWLDVRDIAWWRGVQALNAGLPRARQLRHPRH